MKKLIILCLGAALLVFAVSIVSAIPNPAPVYCAEMGYNVSTDGNNCDFGDGNSCELWAFSRGECGQNYVKDLACVQSGESLRPGHECCQGLSSIGVASVFDGNTGKCMTAVGGWPICAPCGNGTCDREWENKCTCPDDCPGEKRCYREGEDFNLFDNSEAKCCEGLTKINYSFNEGNTCITPTCPCYICTKCGDGHCGIGENKCNCSQDCQTEGSITSKCATVLIPASCSCSEGIVSCPFIIEREEEAISISIEGSTDNGTVLNTKSSKVKTSEKLIVQNSKLYMEINKEKKSEIKVLPEEASSKAVEATGAEQTNEMELKQEQEKPVYSVRVTKRVRLFSFIPLAMNIETKVDAETGDVFSIKKPWWSFFVW